MFIPAHRFLVAFVGRLAMLVVNSDAQPYAARTASRRAFSIDADSFEWAGSAEPQLAEADNRSFSIPATPSLAAFRSGREAA
jgi:hypothetical protein